MVFVGLILRLHFSQHSIKFLTWSAIDGQKQRSLTLMMAMLRFNTQYLMAMAGVNKIHTTFFRRVVEMTAVSLVCWLVAWIRLWHRILLFNFLVWRNSNNDEKRVVSGKTEEGAHDGKQVRLDITHRARKWISGLEVTVPEMQQPLTTNRGIKLMEKRELITLYE